MAHIKFQDSSISSYGQAQTNMAPQLLQSWGIINTNKEKSGQLVLKGR